MVRCMLIESNLPHSLWAEAVNTATFVKNRSPSSALKNKTPFEVWTGRKPNVSFLKTFGCKAVALEKGPGKGKLELRGKEYIFVGHSTGSKGYRLWDGHKSVIVSRDVKLFEKIDPNNYFWINNENNNAKTEEYISIKEENNVKSEETSSEEEFENCQDESNSSDEEKFYGFNEELDEVPTQKDLPDKTRSRGRPKLIRTGNRGRPRKEYNEKVNFAFDETPDDPASLEEALNGPEKEKWIKAMEEEIRCLNLNNTWEIVDRPVGQKVISSKWVFKKKYNNDGSIDKFKARLVARGREQKKGIDYNEIYSPVAKYESIRTLFAL